MIFFGGTTSCCLGRGKIAGAALSDSLDSERYGETFLPCSLKSAWDKETIRNE